MYSDTKKCWICARSVIILTCSHVAKSSLIACHVSQCTLWQTELREWRLFFWMLLFHLSSLSSNFVAFFVTYCPKPIIFFMDFSALPVIFTAGIYTTLFIYILSISVKAFQRRKTNKRGKWRRRKGGVSAFVTQNKLKSLSKHYLSFLLCMDSG